MLRSLIATAVLLGSAAGASFAAAPDGPPVYCPDTDASCYVVADKPGTPGDQSDDTGDTAGGAATCRWVGQVVPCNYALDGGKTGWFNNSDGCYYFLSDPQPPAGSSAWAGHEPGDGAVYLTMCYPADRATDLGYLGIGIVWLAAPPPGFGGTQTPAQLAAQAINQLGLTGPQIGIAPDPGGKGLVGLPVWLWNVVGPHTWGPVSATASVPGLSVTATARGQKIVWNMGDGTTVTCANAGTKYRASFGDAKSPTCGHVYTRPSNGRYTITATTTWLVTWAGGGENGTLTVTRTSQTTVDIDELTVVVR